jgi:hypothetical protein
MQNRDCTCSSNLIGSYDESLLQRQIILRFCLSEESFFSPGLTLVGRKILSLELMYAATSVSMNKAYILFEKSNNVKFDQNFRINH